MTKTTTLATALIATLATPLLAEGIDPAIDTDGNGAYSLQELQAVSPDLTEEMFNSYDISANGLLDSDEVAALVNAGLLPTKDG